MADSETRRRRRPAISCALCRRRKVRCNREQPCSNCLRSRKDVACVYEDLSPTAPNRLRQPLLQQQHRLPQPQQPQQPQQPEQPQQPQRLQRFAARIYPAPISTDHSTQAVVAAVSLRPAPATALLTRPEETDPPFDFDNSLGHPSFANEGRMGPSATLSDGCTRAMRRRIRELETQLHIARSSQPKRHNDLDHSLGHSNYQRLSRSSARTASASASATGNATAVAASPSSCLTQPSPLQPELRSSDADADASADAGSQPPPLMEPPLSGTPSTSRSRALSVAGWPGNTSSASFVGQKQKFARCQGVLEYGQFTSRNVMHKTRLFGQSHWVNSVVGFRDIFESVGLLIEDDKQSKVFVDMHRIKHLARIVKAQRAPQWPAAIPSPPAARRRDLPPRPLADQLVQCYLRSSEGLFRVLHVPLFWKDYETFWADAGAAAGAASNTSAAAAAAASSLPTSAPDTPFLVQLRLVLAIGTASHPEHVRLRPNAIRWVHQALCWAAEPAFKAHLTIQTLQNNVLLLLAREAVGVGAELTWTAVGSLLRSAVFMGLQRDPLLLPRRPTLLAAEMRRRLWNTILELTVNTALDVGGPAMLSLDDFDTKPPGNFDDEELLGRGSNSDGAGGNGGDNDGGDSSIDRENLAEDRQAIAPEGRPPNVFTQTSVAIALRKTFPLRLAIVQFLNSMGHRGSYDETLQIDKEFRAVYRMLCQRLDSFQRSGTSTDGHGSSDEKPIPHIQLALIDLTLQRYLLCLHIPFFGTAVHDLAAYAFSRRVVVDTALKIWNTCTCNTAEYSQSKSEIAPGSFFPPPSTAPFSGTGELTRIALLGPSSFRRMATHACMLVAAELKLKLLEENAQDDTNLMSALASSDPQISLIPVRTDLLAVIKSARDWSLKSIEAGEVNCKGFLFWRLILTQIDGLRRGIMNSTNDTPDTELTLARELVCSAEESLDVCMPLMERHVAEGQARVEAEATAAAAEEEGAMTGGHAVEATTRPDLLNSATIAAAGAGAGAGAGAETNLLARHDCNAMPDNIENWDFLMADMQMSDLGRGNEPYNWLFPNEPAHGPLW